MKPLSEAAVDRAIRKVAQLRALFRRLPHQPTPAECRLLAEFESFRTGQVPEVSPAAARAGFRAAWSARDYVAIVSVAARLDPSLVEGDRTIRTFLQHATILARRDADA